MEEIDKLIKELNELSEFEEQNKERMKEIAKVLVAYYMGGKKGCNVRDAENPLKKETVDKNTVSDVET